MCYEVSVNNFAQYARAGLFTDYGLRRDADTKKGRPEMIPDNPFLLL
jgi:hypothetical protein